MRRSTSSADSCRPPYATVTCIVGSARDRSNRGDAARSAPGRRGRSGNRGTWQLMLRTQPQRCLSADVHHMVSYGLRTHRPDFVSAVAPRTNCGLVVKKRKAPPRRGLDCRDDVTTRRLSIVVPVNPSFQASCRPCLEACPCETWRRRYLPGSCRPRDLLHLRSCPVPLPACICRVRRLSIPRI